MPVSLLVRAMTRCLQTSFLVAFEPVRLAPLAIRSHTFLGGEPFFANNRRSSRSARLGPGGQDDATRWLMATLGRMFPWRNTLVSVKPDTLIRWQTHQL
jgi:putative transposase